MQGKQRPRPQVQRPIILDVLPPDIAPRLDKKPKSFNKKLIKHIPKVLRNRWTAAGGVVVLGTVLVLAWHPWSGHGVSSSNTTITRISDFTPFVVRNGLPPQYQYNEAAASYNEGVLFLQVQGPNGNNVVISEQALPKQLSSTNLQGDRIIVGLPGKAYISVRDGRTIGELITNEKAPALISLSASSTVSSDVMQQIMQTLQPVK